MINKVILVEFVVIDRFHCGIQIPYINGFLRKKGISTVYLRSGLIAKEALNKKNRVRIDDESGRTILKFVKENDVGFVVFSHQPDELFIKKLNASVYWIETFDDSTPNIADFYHRFEIDEKTLLENTPDFSFVNVNKMAREFRPLPHLVLFNECNYRRSVRKNIFYKDISFPNYVKKKGCTFCINPDNFRRERFDEDKIRKHIQSAIYTTQWGGFRKRLRIIGEIIVHNIDRFFDVILKSRIDETDFLFNFRVDNFIKNVDKIEKVLRLLSKTRNKFYLALVGIENFSNVELERYNKGFKNYDIFRFLSAVFELKNKYPNHFDYEEYGGFSLILFNPFTTIEDLRLNYHLIKYLGIERLCGKLFTARIRLYKELPIYYLAQFNELIRSSYSQEDFDTAKVNFYRKEEPWEFKDKSVKRFNRFLIANSINNVDKTIKYLSANYKAGLMSKKVLNNHSLYENDIIIYYKIESEFMKTYKNRKVGKIEVSSKEDLEINYKYAKQNFPYVEIRDNRSNVGGLRFSIFYGFSNLSISECAELTKKIESGIRNENKQIELYFKIGKLLGYPACCAKYYAENKYYLVNNYMFLMLYLRYLQHNIFRLMNPFVDLYYIPCSLRCNNTLNVMRLYHKLKKIYYKSNKVNLGLDSPIIFLLPFDPLKSDFTDNTGSVVVKLVKEVRDGFSYSPIFYSGQDKRLSYILSSDRLIMKDGFMELYKGKKHIHTFCAEANVWYYRKTFDYKFWREFSEAYYKSVIFGNRFSQISNSFIGDYSNLFNNIEKNMDLFSEYGYKVIDKRREQNVAVVLLEKSDKTIELRIQKREEAGNYYIKGRKYAISIGSNIDNPELVKVATEIMMKIIDR